MSRSTVVNIPKEAGLDPIPERTKGTWSDFVRRRAATLWACDLLGVKTRTASGPGDVYLLVFIHVGTRRAFASGITARPDAAWVTRQARNASMQMAEWKLPATPLPIDHDTKFVAGFDAVLEDDGAEVVRFGPQAPNLISRVERFLQSLRVECLVLGERHLRHLTSSFLARYNAERPHQAVGTLPLTGSGPDPPASLPFPPAVVCHQRLGGLLKNYARAA